MRRKIIVVTMLCLLLMVSVACADNSTVDELEGLELSSLIHFHPQLENIVSMVVSEIDRSENQVTVTIFNDSEYELMTGEHFTVEVFDGEYWRNVPWNDPYIAFVDIGYAIYSDDSMDFTKNLTLVNPLASGLYRIRKSVFRPIDRPIQDSDLHDVIAEFHWET